MSTKGISHILPFVCPPYIPYDRPRRVRLVEGAVFTLYSERLQDIAQDMERN